LRRVRGTTSLPQNLTLTRSIPSETNELFVFGIGENYQLGLGTTNNAPLPQEVVALRGENIVQVACGWGHNVALTASGDVITWGWNQDGQCGTGDTQNVCEPKKVAADIFRGTKIVSVAAGADHSMAIDSA
jgi:alpha-tubulin suppressor-like RCC1 family protein